MSSDHDQPKGPAVDFEILEAAWAGAQRLPAERREQAIRAIGEALEVLSKEVMA